MGFSPNVTRVQPSATIAVSSLAKRLRAEGRDIINLSAGEPDFDTPGWIADAAVEGIRAGRTRYTPAAGIPELRQAIAEFLAHNAGRPVQAAGVVVSAGTKQALFNAVFCLFGPGDEVLVASPYWTSYPEIVTLARAESVFVTGAETRDFKLSPRDLEAVTTELTAGLILSTPSNPTGAVYSREELAAVARWARERGIWLITDEIYRHIYFGDDAPFAPGILDLDDDDRGRFVLVSGVSKSFAMTGWRLGFAYAPDQVAAKMSALQSHTTSNAATPSQVAALRAYSEPREALASVGEMVIAFRRRRDLVTGLMRELLPAFSFVEPMGAFYLFFRVDSLFRDAVSDSSAFCTWLLEQTGVALVPGAAFGDDRFVRMSFAASDDVLEEGVRRVAQAVGALG